MSAYPSAGDAGFPPPPASGFPPAPAPGYGGYGAPGGYQTPADATSGFSWGWQKFTQNWGSIVLAQLLWGILIGIVVGIFYGIIIATMLAGADSSGNVSGGFAAAGLVGGAIMVFAIVLASLFSQIGLLNGYLAIADGRTPVLKDFFTFRNVGAAIIASLLVALASLAGAFLLYIGALVVGWFALFVMPFVIDRNLSAMDAIKASIQVTMKNPGQTILLYLLVQIAAAVGAAICGVGALVTVPLGALATIYLYRRLTGGQVAA